MESIHSRIKAFDNYVGSSTFGRIFRLEGSGHVSREIHYSFDGILRASCRTRKSETLR